MCFLASQELPKFLATKQNNRTELNQNDDGPFLNLETVISLHFEGDSGPFLNLGTVISLPFEGDSAFKAIPTKLNQPNRFQPNQFQPNQIQLN